MRICPSCGVENADDRDFCECGEYLRWEPTQHVQTVKPAASSAAPAAAAAAATPQMPAASYPDAAERNRRTAEPHHASLDPDVTMAPAAVAGTPPTVPRGPLSTSRAHPAPEAPPGVATLLLRLPDADSDSSGSPTVSVIPGQRVTLVGLIRNESDIVDNYDLAISGLPQDWWTIAPAAAYLVPMSTSGNYEQEFQIHIHPPRTPDAHARPWSFEVVAGSRAYQAQVASAPATVTIEPYQDVAAKLAPDRASGRLKAGFVLIMRNRANAPAEVTLSAEDQDGDCEFRFAAPSVTIEAGQGVEAPLTVFPPKQIWVGRPLDRPIRVTATPTGLDTPAPPLPAIFRQRPWLPWWLSILIPIVAALIVLLILLAPKQTVVPNLKSAKSVFDAQKKLTSVGLKLNPNVTQKADPQVAPGAIIDQDPAAGKKAKSGSMVSVVVATGSGQIQVPSLAGLTPVAADTKLRAAQLTLGAVSPKPDPNGKIASQIPAANVPVKSGTAIAVFLQPPPASKGASGTSGSGNGAKTGAAAAGAAAAGVTPAAGNPVTVPKVSGTPVAASQKLSQLGLVPSQSNVISSAPKGAVAGTNPPAGSQAKSGDKVAVLVSAGFPELSYDNGTVVHIVDGNTGKRAADVPSSGQPQDQATWSIDGSHVVYVQGPANAGQLWLYAPGQNGAQPIPLSAANSNFHNPAFAPTTQSNILAFIQVGSGDDKLCFATVGPNALNPDCTDHPGWDLGRQIAWSPDGTAILVFGSKHGDPQQFGLIEFVSNVPFSEHASDWGHGTVVTDTTRPGQGVIAGSFSPNGKQVALASNFGTADFHVFLAPRSDFLLAPPAKALPTRACQIAWRSDGKELAVMQADSQCQALAGDIVAVDPSNPNIERAIATQAANPQWQPLPLGG
jgi:beta-lactam-binding protein with PASTA domain